MDTVRWRSWKKNYKKVLPVKYKTVFKNASAGRENHVRRR